MLISKPEELMDCQCEITTSKIQTVNLTLISPMKLPFGTISQRPSGIIILEANIKGKIFEGFGEGATLPKPLFTDDSGETIGLAMAELVTDISRKPMNFETAIRLIQSHQFEKGSRFPTARMAAEMAVIDLWAKSLGLNAGALLGMPGSIREVPFGKSIGGGNFESTIRDAEEAIKNRAKKIKLKITPDSSETVIGVISRLRSDHPDLELMVDANGTFNPEIETDLQKLRELDQLKLLMIEEPVSRVGNIRGVEAVRLLRSTLELITPICLDDCLVDLETTELALNDGLADIINIKPGRIGSIMKAIELAKRCKNLNKQVMVGGMLEATPGRCMTTILGALFLSMGFNIPGDLSLAQERLSEDLVDRGAQLQIGPGGGILLPRGNGWGCWL